MEVNIKMFGRVVGAVAVLAVTIGTLGMGIPQENENQTQNANVVDTTAATVAMVAKMQETQQNMSTAQAQEAESISQIADGEAVIQDSIVPLVENIVEANKRKTTLTDEELDLLLRVVSAEARGESWEAQYNVACVVLNRMESEIFPDDLEGVIMQKGQFSCVPNGAIYNVPITESVKEAVESALDDNTLDRNVLWFRSGYYHTFRKDAFRIGQMFFSI